MTDNEIVKALECCGVDPNSGKYADCKNCPLDSLGNANCFNFVIQQHALDLIKRQQAEIESMENCERILICQLAEERNKAIKEFAERLKAELTTGAAIMRVSVLGIIDDLAKKMTEETT